MKKYYHANLFLGLDFLGRAKYFTDISYIFNEHMEELGQISIFNDITGFCVVNYGRKWSKESLQAHKFIVRYH